MSNFQQFLESEEAKQQATTNGQQSATNLVFPVDAFPKQIQDIILAYNTALNFPVDYLATSILFTSSLAIGNTHNVEIKNGFIINGVLYCALVGKPGAMKTPPLNFALRPIWERDKQAIQLYKEEFQQYQEKLALSKKQKEQLGVEPASPPVYKKTVCSDYTPEVLAEIHDNNRRGIGVVNDELTGWIKNFGRYNSGSEVERWLTMWSGQPLVIDRKSGDKVFIDKPFVSVIGGIQPGRLEVLTKDGNNENGFIERLLFAYPNDMDKRPWNDQQISPIYECRYHDYLNKILNLPDDTSVTLTFNPEAKKMLLEWNSTLTKEVNESPDYYRSILTKFEYYVPRFAMIVNIMRWACGEANQQKIDLGSMISALQLYNYFKSTALKVNQQINSTPLERLPENIKAWYEALQPETTTSEAKKQGVMQNLKV